MSPTDPPNSATRAGPPERNQPEDNQRNEKELEIHELPSPKEIRDAIPPEGIDWESLAAKFAEYIDETNVALFKKLVMAVCNSEKRLWLSPLDELPSQTELDLIICAAKKPAPPEPKLDKKTYDVSTTYISNMNVTFQEPSELVRNAGNMLPDCLYRVFYENSATLSSYVDKATHVNHIEKQYLKLREGNAFQAIGDFNAIRDITRSRIERHLCWQKKQDPSSFISTYNNLNQAVRRARFHYNESRKVGRRISIAQISTQGLVAATIRVRQEKVTREWEGTKRKSQNVTREDIEIPIWVREDGVPPDGATLEIQDLVETHADIWLSIPELRRSNLKVRCTRRHDYEWLACGSIPVTQVIKVMPFDGETLYTHLDENDVVRSLHSTEPWYFDSASSMWYLEPLKEETTVGGDGDSGGDAGSPNAKRRKLRHKHTRVYKDAETQTSRLTKASLHAMLASYAETEQGDYQSDDELSCE